jgi:O-antigen/teichoic acid export membrane protein
LATAIYTVPRAVTRNLIVEFAASREDRNKHISHAIKILAYIEIPIIIFITVFGHRILRIFGNSYSANSYGLLILLVFSLIPLTANTIYWALFNARDESYKLFWINFVSTVLVLLLSYIFIIYWKLLGVGIAWFVVQLVQLAFYIKMSQSFQRSTSSPLTL